MVVVVEFPWLAGSAKQEGGRLLGISSGCCHASCPRAETGFGDMQLGMLVEGQYRQDELGGQGKAWCLMSDRCVPAAAESNTLSG